MQYTVSEGKPYVTGLANFQDDTEDGSFWFIYKKPLSSTGNPTPVEESKLIYGVYIHLIKYLLVLKCFVNEMK